MMNRWLLILSAMVGLLAACNNSDSPTGGSGGEGDIYPMYVDTNQDGVNDYVQATTHDPGSTGRHAYVDTNGDGICDGAQDGSTTWHGPGFVDENGNGICDRWESGMRMYGQSGDMQYRDGNKNGVNDYAEAPWHGQPGHAYVDNNGDGICDHAQDGSTTWHGPGFVDNNGDGICDNWQSGGRGYGEPGKHTPMPGGGMHR